MARRRARLDTLAVRLIRIETGEFASSLAASCPERAWRISFRERGQASLAGAEGTTALLPGRPIVIAPDMGSALRPEGRALHFLAEFELAKSRAAAALPVGGPPLALDAEPRRDGLARELLQELASGAPATPAHYARAIAFVQLCLSSLIQAADADHGANGGVHGARQQLQPALRYIDAHLADVLSNSKLAELSHASESHFIRLFRRTFGCTPARHVQERRVSNAAELLVQTRLSIDEIAERCGFANRYHFTRVFAQRMAQPPARFRAL
ncbi:MAG TPA: AraC family transcriptional regulator, partial [Myxococcota bacterium]|nr:AraC family transcriptional regulator [Myxococcota bacterium]